MKKKSKMKRFALYERVPFADCLGKGNAKRIFRIIV